MESSVIWNVVCIAPHKAVISKPVDASLATKGTTPANATPNALQLVQIVISKPAHVEIAFLAIMARNVTKNVAWSAHQKAVISLLASVLHVGRVEKDPFVM